MINNRDFKKIILFFVIVTSVLLFVQIKRNQDNSRPQLYKSIKKLPKLKIEDVNGNLVGNNELEGKNIYLQFVDPSNYYDMTLIKAVHSNWKEEDISIIVVSNDVESFKTNSGIEPGNVIVLTSSYKKIKSKFKSPDNQGTYYIFDKKGVLVVSEKNEIGYENGPKVFLKQIINNEYFKISDFIIEGNNINDVEHFREITMHLPEIKKKFSIICLFCTICNTCTSGAIINALNDIHRNDKRPVYVLGVLNNKFSDADLKSLRSQLDIHFPFVIADSTLSKKWNSLISNYRESDLDNIVFVTNNSGKILRVLHKSCDCWDSFFKYLFSAMDE